MRFITLKKEQNNYDVLLLLLQISHLSFISNSVVFVDREGGRGRKYFLSHGAGYPSYTAV